MGSPENCTESDHNDEAWSTMLERNQNQDMENPPKFSLLQTLHEGYNIGDMISQHATPFVAETADQMIREEYLRAHPKEAEEARKERRRREEE